MIYVDETEPEGDADILAPFQHREVTIRNGEKVADRYEMIDLLGRGKFGTVYRCREISTGITLAAKFVGTPRKQDKQDVAREVDIMQSLRHPRLLQLYDAFDDGKKEMCLVMELIQGGELFERVIDDDFILTEKVCSIFMHQICDGVSYMHNQNILHLDLKPENVLCLTRTGNRIKLIDFGLARRYDPKKKLQVLFGTPEFVAPEVVNFEQIGYGTDMWSLGVICYVLLSGLSPFMGDSDVETMANVTIANYDFDDEAFDSISESAKDFIRKLLVKDKDKRMTATESLKHPWLQRKPPKPPPRSRRPTQPRLSLDVTKMNLEEFVERWATSPHQPYIMSPERDDRRGSTSAWSQATGTNVSTVANAPTPDRSPEILSEAGQDSELEIAKTLEEETIPPVRRSSKDGLIGEIGAKLQKCLDLRKDKICSPEKDTMSPDSLDASAYTDSLEAVVHQDSVEAAIRWDSFDTELRRDSLEAIKPLRRGSRESGSIDKSESSTETTCEEKQKGNPVKPSRKRVTEDRRDHFAMIHAPSNPDIPIYIREISLESVRSDASISERYLSKVSMESLLSDVSERGNGSEDEGAIFFKSHRLSPTREEEDAFRLRSASTETLPLDKEEHLCGKSIREEIQAKRRSLSSQISQLPSLSESVSFKHRLTHKRRSLHLEDNVARATLLEDSCMGFGQLQKQGEKLSQDSDIESGIYSRSHSKASLSSSVTRQVETPNTSWGGISIQESLSPSPRGSSPIKFIDEGNKPSAPHVTNVRKKTEESANIGRLEEECSNTSQDICDIVVS